MVVEVKKRLVVLGTGLLLFFTSNPVFASKSEALFAQLLKTPAQKVTSKACPLASKYQYIFVAGIFNELMPYYFKDQIDWLARCQVPAGQIQLARPYSGNGLSRSSDSLKDLIREVLFKNPSKPLIIMGHSKGAPEALLAALQSPFEIQQKISAVICIQGSFGGSPIADMALGAGQDAGNPNYKFIARVARRLMSWLKRVEYIYGKSVHDGVYSVKTSEAKHFWPLFLDTHQNDDILIENKVLVLQTYKHYRRINPLFFLSGQYLDKLTGEKTDGAIPFSSQRPPIDGIHPAILELDHLDTVLPKAFSFSSPLIRQQIIAAAIGSIFFK